MDLPVQSIDALRGEGHEAFSSGGDWGANPYPYGCVHWRAWADGYRWALLLARAEASRRGGA